MYYSIGGGFVVRDGQPPDPPAEVPLRFTTGDELLKLCEEQHASMWEIVWRNECALRPEAEVRAGLLRIWAAMVDCIDAGFHRRGSAAGRARGTPSRAGVFSDS